MKENPYLADILTQADALGSALSRFDPKSLMSLADELQNRRFDRVIMTGMGASLYACYPAWLNMTSSGLPVIWVDTAELIHYARDLIGDRTLLWVVSQSGRSAEILALLYKLRAQPQVVLLGTVNDLESSLGQAADYLIPIDATAEQTVSTRTTVNTIAITQLSAQLFCGQDLTTGLNDLEQTCRGMATYLRDWQAHLEALDDVPGLPETLVLLGRGASVASAYYGALVLGEASKYPAIGMQAAEFRHGPVEITNPDLTVLLCAGPLNTLSLNLGLLHDLVQYGAKVCWLSVSEETDLPEEHRAAGAAAISAPRAQGIGLPIAELLPVQLLSVSIGLRLGIVPGEFKFIGKVTLSE